MPSRLASLRSSRARPCSHDTCPSRRLAGERPGASVKAVPTIERVCVHCASSPGHDPAIRAATIELGRLLASQGLGLVYGGGKAGLMGLVADTVMEAGGTVTGVIPRRLF